MLDAADFRARLRAPALIRLYDYWQSIRRDRPMPEWRDIRPEEMAIVLPHVWAWRVDAEDEPRLRLVGESVYQAMSRDLRGKQPEDLYAAGPAADIRSRLVKIVRTPAGSLTHGDALHLGEKIGTGERLGLPYADGANGWGVIGASVLTPSIDPSTGEPRAVDPKAFFPLVGAECFLRIEYDR